MERQGRVGGKNRFIQNSSIWKMVDYCLKGDFLFLECLKSFIGAREEVERRKRGGSHATRLGECPLESGLFHDG